MRERWRKQAIIELLSKYHGEEDEQVAALLHQHAEVAMRLELAGEEDYSQTGNSRVAGRPDLPPSIAWPCTEDGEWYTFLAQINLGELPFTSADDLPATGMLYFFLGADEPAYNVDHRVIYYEGDLQQLTLADPPADKEEVYGDEREFVAHRATFAPHLSLADLGEETEELMDKYEELYLDVCDQSDALWGGLQSWSGDTSLHAYLCRSGMEALLYNTHRTEEELREKAREALAGGQNQYAEHIENERIPLLQVFKARESEHREAARNWRLLFSLSSLDAAGMCWWDAGFLEFLIDRNDLRQRRFDNTYVNLATS